MRNLKLIALSILASIAFVACDEPVKFSEPQPTGKSNLSGFPNRLRGLYKSTTDDNFIEITDKTMVMKWNNEVSIPKSEVDTSHQFTLRGNLLIDSSNNISIRVNLINDTLCGFIKQCDTVFKVDNVNVLRKFRGHYFANTKYDVGSYSVMMITYERGGHLLLSQIKKEEIENLKAVTETEEPDDSTCATSYQFTPTKKEFKKFVNEMHGFRDNTEFIKVRMK